MKAPLSDFDEPSLVRLGAEAAQLLGTGDIEALCAKFGYALAFDREPFAALSEDLAKVLAEAGVSSFKELGPPSVKVSHLQPSETGLLSLVESWLAAGSGKQVLVELVLSASDSSEAWVTLEQISAVG